MLIQMSSVSGPPGHLGGGPVGIGPGLIITVQGIDPSTSPLLHTLSPASDTEARP